MNMTPDFLCESKARFYFKRYRVHLNIESELRINVESSEGGGAVPLDEIKDGSAAWHRGPAMIPGCPGRGGLVGVCASAQL